MRKPALGVGVAVLAALFVVGPVAAAAGPEDINCRYKATQVGRFGWTEARLQRISVRPPEIYAVGVSSQTAAWRFMVRRYIGNSPSEWKQTYRSPWQTATARASVPAPFTPMSVDVNLPTVSGDYDLTDVHYYVAIKQVRYNRDGTVYGTSIGGEGKYRFYVDGKYLFSSSDFEGCAGEIRQFFN